MGKTVFVIHTSMVSLKDLTALFNEITPDTLVRNIVDDSLLPEVINNGGLTERVRKRMRYYALAAVEGGADLIFNQCSSVREAAEEATKDLPVPFCSIDERMAETACDIGERIAIVATLKTTLGPTSRLVERVAQAKGRVVQIIPKLCEGAFDKLIAGDTATHNAMVVSAIRDLEKNADVVVCAQGSMVALLPDLGETAVPILTSPRLGVQKAAEILVEQGRKICRDDQHA